MEVLGPCVMLTIPIVFIAIAIYSATSERDKWNAALADVAEALGITARAGGWQNKGTARGTIDDIEVVIDTYTTGSGKSRTRWTRWRLQDPHGPRADIGSEGALSFLGKAFHGNDLQIGDAAFDDRVLIRSDFVVDLRARLDHPNRTTVMTAVADDWTMTDGQWMHRQRGLVTSGFALEHVAQSGLDLCRALRLQDAAPASLQAIVSGDPHMGVRVRALESWLRDAKPSDGALRQVIAANNDLLGLMAARALGDPEHLHPFLEHIDRAVRVQAAIIASEGGESSAAIEAGLTSGLELEQWTDRCIARLSRVGSVSAVPALSPFAEGMMPTARKRAATDAIQGIQSRQQGAAAGQISIVEVQGGELSVGEIERSGQLSESRKRQTD